MRARSKSLFTPEGLPATFGNFWKFGHLQFVRTKNVVNQLNIYLLMSIKLFLALSYFGGKYKFDFF